MKKKISKGILLFILFSTLLTSCSLFRTQEEKNRQLAVDTAVAFFTFDYQHPDRWMDSVKKEDYYDSFIKTKIKSHLVPYLQNYFVKSAATSVSIDEYARGIDSDDTEVIVWEIQLQVDPVWPGKTPPSPLDQPPLIIPWTNPEQTTGDIANTTVYAVATGKLGLWSVKLISAGQLEDVASTFVPQ